MKAGIRLHWSPDSHEAVEAFRLSARWQRHASEPRVSEAHLCGNGRNSRACAFGRHALSLEELQQAMIAVLHLAMLKGNRFAVWSATCVHGVGVRGGRGPEAS